MDRLTKRAEYHCACWNGDQNFSTHKRYMELLDRLAAYEDTGLEPDEIPQLKAQLDAVLEDLYYIHCAGQKGCAICRNADQCGEQDSHIGDCVGFEWRGPQPLKEEK